MPKKNRFRLPFTKQMDSGHTVTPLTPTATDIPISKWYRSITTLPLNKFIEAAVDGNLAALTISGFPNPNDLILAWNDMQQEYADAIGDSQHKIYLSALKEIVLLRTELTIIEDMIDLLRKVYYKPFADRLNKLLFSKYALDYTDPEKYNKELSACFMRSRGRKINLDLKQLKFDGLKVEGDGNKPTREYYLTWLMYLSDHAKYPIQETITTFEFCTRIQKYNKYVQEMEAMYKKK